MILIEYDDIQISLFYYRKFLSCLYEKIDLLRAEYNSENREEEGSIGRRHLSDHIPGDRLHRSWTTSITYSERHA